MDTLKDRLNAFIQSLKISKNEFAREIGTSSAMISKITTKEVNFGIDIYQKIIGRYSNLNEKWLLTGIGEMWKNKPTQFQVSKETKEFIDNSLVQIGKQLDEQAIQQRILKETTDEVPLRYTRKIYENLEEEYPDLYKIKMQFDTLLLFKDAIEEIEEKIGSKLQNAFWLFPKGKFDFKKYESQVIAALQDTYVFEKALNDINTSIVSFYEQIKLIDDEILNFDDYIAS